MNHHKRGFTLTELLIVVIVIGILSAVVLPRYNKTIETRKTTEAEDILSAIRTEQERRCTLGKKYVTDMAGLSEIVPNTETNNYTYSLFSTNAGGQGLSWHTVSARAISRGSYEYGLYMFSNSDGRICCQGPDCTKLNKDYPLCEELVTHTDLQRSAFEEARECGFETAAPIPNPPTPPIWEEEYQVGFTLEGKEPGGSGGGDDGGDTPEPELEYCDSSEEMPCGCANLGTKFHICNLGTHQWMGWTDCQLQRYALPWSEECECEPGDVKEESCGCEEAGRTTRGCSELHTWTGTGQCLRKGEPWNQDSCECSAHETVLESMGENPGSCAAIPVNNITSPYFSQYGRRRCTDIFGNKCPSKLAKKVKYCDDRSWVRRNYNQIEHIACPCAATTDAQSALRAAGLTEEQVRLFVDIPGNATCGSSSGVPMWYGPGLPQFNPSFYD